MGGESKGLSAEVSQSAAAGLLWLSEGKGDHGGNVAGGGGALSRFFTQLNGTRLTCHSSTMVCRTGRNSNVETSSYMLWRTGI